MSREPTMPGADVLSAYLDGECTAVERAEVEQRLATSPELRAELADVRAARDAVRALPQRDAPPEFWARLHDTVSIDDADGEPALAAVVAVPIDRPGAPRRDPRRWVAAAAGAAAAAVIAAILLVPEQERVTPPVATFTDAHAVRSSLQNDAVSTLAPLAVQAGFRR